MNDAEKMLAAAQVFATSVECLCILEGMKALNTEREAREAALAYDEEAFISLPQRMGCDVNSVHEVLYRG